MGAQAVRTPKVPRLRDETEKRSFSILHEVLLECDASSHRFPVSSSIADHPVTGN